MRLLIICIVTIGLSLLTQALFAIDATVIINSVKINDGRIMIGLFNDPKEYPNGKQYKGQFTTSETQTVRVIFTDLHEGKYAVVAYQDKNLNEKLDMSFLGIPKEKYGFSGRQVFGTPEFEDSAVEINANTNQIKVDLH